MGRGKETGCSLKGVGYFEESRKIAVVGVDTRFGQGKNGGRGQGLGGSLTASGRRRRISLA